MRISFRTDEDDDDVTDVEEVTAAVLLTPPLPLPQVADEAEPGLLFPDDVCSV